MKKYLRNDGSAVNNKRLVYIVLYMFNFGTKTFIVRLVIDDVTVVTMLPYERFVHC